MSEKRTFYIGLTVGLLALASVLIGVRTIAYVLIGIAIAVAPIVIAWRISFVVKLEKRPTWNLCTAIIILTMIGGLVLSVAWPFYLAPPRFGYTPLVYLICAGLWFPVLLICIALRPTGWSLFSAVAVLLVIGLVGCFISTAVSGTNLAIWIMDPSDCREEPLPDGQVRYICKHTLSFGGTSSYNEFTLEGAAGSPFVRVVKKIYGNYP